MPPQSRKSLLQEQRTFESYPGASLGAPEEFMNFGSEVGGAMLDRRDFLMTTLAASMAAADAQVHAQSPRLFPGLRPAASRPPAR
jgi:hypothetical protein